MSKQGRALHERVHATIVSLGGVAQLQEIYDALPNDSKEQIRSVIYRHMEGTKKKFVRVLEKGAGVYMAISPDSKVSTLLIEGNGRNLDFLENESIDAIVTDHPWADKKAHTSGNQDHFAGNYADTCFRYTREDIRRKYEVLKEGGFCVELFPQFSGTNINYFLDMVRMFQEEGFEFYTSLQWVKGDLAELTIKENNVDSSGKSYKAGDKVEVFNSVSINTGRKTKDGDQIFFFTKGKARSLSPYKAKIKKRTKSLAEESKKIIDLYSTVFDSHSIENFLDASQEFLQEPCENYTSKSGFKKLSLFMNDDIDKGMELKEGYCMSGTRWKLPARFVFPEDSRKERLQKTQKPVALYEAIIDAITKRGEVVLDQFAGSGNCGKAALNIGRFATLVELSKERIQRAAENLGAANIRPMLENGLGQTKEKVREIAQKAMLPKTQEVAQLSFLN